MKSHRWGISSEPGSGQLIVEFAEVERDVSWGTSISSRLRVLRHAAARRLSKNSSFFAVSPC